jgi:hypothetical protein
LYLPLRFFACSDDKAYFPSILVPNTRVRIELDVEDFANVHSALAPVEPPAIDMVLVADHFMLTRDERNSLLLQPCHSLMMEGAQDMDGVNYEIDVDGTVRTHNTISVDLSELNLAVKALIWVVYQEGVLFEYLDAVQDATLLFGSLERVAASGKVFARQQIWTHARRCLPGNVYMYSFALDACRAAPCGALDFSVLSKPVLRVRLAPAFASRAVKCKVWGITYNWLKFERNGFTRLFSV